MGLTSGSANLVEFEVIGDLPDSKWDFAKERIRTFGFQDIDDTYDEYSIGWVSPLDMFVSEFESEDSGIIVASMRIDERKVPAAVIKKAVGKAFKQEMESRQIPRLGKGVKADIKVRVVTELVRKAEPVATVVEMVWDMERREVFFFSTNRKMQALFEDFFKECFGVMLQQRIPYTIAESMDDVDKDKLAEVSACKFN